MRTIFRSDILRESTARQAVRPLPIFDEIILPQQGPTISKRNCASWIARESTCRYCPFRAYFPISQTKAMQASGADQCQNQTASHVTGAASDEHSVSSYVLSPSKRSRDGGTFRVPIGALLQKTCRSHHGAVVSHTRKKLNAGRQLLCREPARHTDCRQPTEIPNPADRVSETEIGLEIGFKRRCRNRQGWRGDHVEFVKKRIHSLLKHAADLQRTHEVGSGDLLIRISADLPERVGPLCHFA